MKWQAGRLIDWLILVDDAVYSPSSSKGEDEEQPSSYHNNVMCQINNTRKVAILVDDCIALQKAEIKEVHVDYAPI